MSDIIQLLPDHVANQIAAGEVVQRPASVVKELLENAIDAGASQVKLIVKDAGKTLIQVTDDGVGMSTTDARMCFERHATSKITSADDLFQVQTKGFRGEALASIAAVAQVELKSKTEDAQMGTSVRIDGSKVQSQEPVVTPKGTSVAVKNLFFNIPARRNFLKSDPVENRHIIDEFHRVALAHPPVSFVMLNNGAEVFNLPASNLRQRIVGVFGPKTDDKLVPVSEKTDLVAVNGFAIKPEFAKKTRGNQFFFVNKRFVKSGYLHHAVQSAFEGLLKDRTNPGYFLYLGVPAKSIDINIHPTKTEIKFEDEHAIYAVLRAAVKHSLGQFSIAPVLDFDRDKRLDTPYELSKKTPKAPEIQVDRDFNPFREEGRFKKEKTGGWEKLYEGLNDPETASIEVESDEVTGSLLTGSETAVETAHAFQLHGKYIVSPVKSGLLIVHQHRAHRRILYENILQHLSEGKSQSQKLLFPLQLSFSTRETTLLREVKGQLEQAGFQFEGFEKDSITFSGIPVAATEAAVPAILEALIAELQNDTPDAGFSQNELLAQTLAKSMAVKTGTRLSAEQQESIIDRLFACREPALSPDNKPVYTILEEKELTLRL